MGAKMERRRAPHLRPRQALDYRRTPLTGPPYGSVHEGVPPCKICSRAANSAGSFGSDVTFGEVQKRLNVISACGIERE